MPTRNYDIVQCITVQISVAVAEKCTNRSREESKKFRDRLLMCGNSGNSINNKIIT